MIVAPSLGGAECRTIPLVTMNLTPDPSLDDSPTMTPTERRASGTLASIFALRMLGLFLVLPVFALEARKYPGGDDPALIGLAMGIYGLTQGVLQIPFGMASDRFGRKRVIVLGLLVFALGSAMAGMADTLNQLLMGRALQGAGAVSAAVTALLADLTRDNVRTKALPTWPPPKSARGWPLASKRCLSAGASAALMRSNFKCTTPPQHWPKAGPRAYRVVNALSSWVSADAT